MDCREDGASAVSPGLLVSSADVPEYNPDFDVAPNEWVRGLGPGGLGNSTSTTSDISPNYRADETLVPKKRSFPCVCLALAERRLCL